MPIILTDSLYALYGGNTGTYTSEMRQVGYDLAESYVSELLDTYLQETIVTGTYSRSMLPYQVNTYVRGLYDVVFQSHTDWGETLQYSGTGYVVNYEDGVIQPVYVSECPAWDDVRITYSAGLVSGSSYSPYDVRVLTALVLSAEEQMKLLYSPHELESVGDVGVQNYKNGEYSEERVKLGRTNFGTSAIAQKITNLLSKMRRKRVLRL